jgi:hypothetical protein
MGVWCCGNDDDVAINGITRVVKKYQFDAAATETTDWNSR